MLSFKMSLALLTLLFGKHVWLEISGYFPKKDYNELQGIYRDFLPKTSGSF